MVHGILNHIGTSQGQGLQHTKVFLQSDEIHIFYIVEIVFVKSMYLTLRPRYFDLTFYFVQTALQHHHAQNVCYVVRWFKI